MINKSAIITLAFLLLTTASQSHAASANAVRGFVYEWFGLFDRNAPTDEFLSRLDQTDLQVDFPEERLASHADFAAWYQGIIATFQQASHDIKSLSVTPQGGGLWLVDLTVEWRATQYDGGNVQGLFRQNWRIVQLAGDRLVIRRNVITPVTTSGLYQPVATLAEVPAGDDYGLRQPPVESPTLLSGKRIALLASPGVEDDEITFPIDYFTARGATVDVVAPSWTNGRLLGVNYTKPTYWVTVTKTIEQALEQSYDLIIVTGGPWNSGVLRSDAGALALIKQQHASGRLLAPICSGSQVLIDSGLGLGTNVTGAPNVRIDLENAGATYVDQPVVRDGNLITGQDPRALPAFVDALSQALRAN